MASICNRFISRSSPFIKSAVRSNGPNPLFPDPPPLPPFPHLSPPLPYLLFAVSPPGVHRSWDLCSHCCRYTAQVAVARMTSCLSTTSRSCRALSQEFGQSVPR
ncbi:hypothetical protein V6Z11_D08G202500 [Gossypium hirsutum]